MCDEGTSGEEAAAFRGSDLRTIKSRARRLGKGLVGLRAARGMSEVMMATVGPRVGDPAVGRAAPAPVGCVSVELDVDAMDADAAWRRSRANAKAELPYSVAEVLASPQSVEMEKVR